MFNQSQAKGENQHTLLLDESLYPEDDAEIQRILRRLLMAAASSDIRQDLNVEDEYYSYLEQKETEVLIKDKIIAQKDAQLSQKDAQLSKSIKMLIGAGLPKEKVAENLGVDIETVKGMLDS